MDVFDQNIAGQLPAEVIWRTERLIAFLDARPLFAGHTLVCPVEHYETLYELPEDYYTEILAAAQAEEAARKAAAAAAAANKNNSYSGGSSSGGGSYAPGTPQQNAGSGKQQAVVNACYS